MSVAKAFPEQDYDPIRKLREPIDPKLIKTKSVETKKGGSYSADYIEWSTVADILDKYAPNWSYEISDPYEIAGYCVIRAAITINGITRWGIGTEEMSSTSFGGPFYKAEAHAMKRAAAKFGVGRDLYQDADVLGILEGSESSERPHQQTAKPRSAEPQYKPGEYGFPKNPKADSVEDMVTPRQLVAIRAIANSMGSNADDECNQVFKCALNEISRRAASAFIDYLKQRASGQIAPPEDPAEDEPAEATPDNRKIASQIIDGYSQLREYQPMVKCPDIDKMSDSGLKNALIIVQKELNKYAK